MIEADEEQEVVEKKEISKPFKDEVVKKIDIEKTIPKKIELPKEEEIKEEVKEEINVEKPVLPKRSHRVTPVIFDEDDFVMEEEPIAPPKREIKKEEPKKPLYSGYREDRQKEKFKPSPVLSPVYGFVGVSPVLEQPRNDGLSSFNEMFAQEKKETITLDSVRQKAYGGVIPKQEKEEEDDDLGLLYEMKQEESPAISKITLGDAEEYFDDLGLEYNVDYKDVAKEKRSSSRSEKNNDLPEQLEQEETLEETMMLDPVEEPVSQDTAELEITKEQLKPKTAKEIKKVKKIKDLDISGEPENKEEVVEPTSEEPDEKNLYDLIDMMYESKE